MKLEKVTESGSGGAKRRYDDACAATHGMDIIGERWALPVMRELMMGPRRFGELRRSLPALSANVLTQRLEGLEAAGIVVRRKLPPPASVQVYELTPWGQEAGPIFQELGRWAARSSAARSDAAVQPGIDDAVAAHDDRPARAPGICRRGSGFASARRNSS